MIDSFFAGAAVISLLVIVFFFLKFWRRIRDQLFLYFAAAFLILMIERIVRAFTPLEVEWAPFVFSIRLAAFLCIIWAVVDKNRRWA